MTYARSQLIIHKALSLVLANILPVCWNELKGGIKLYQLTTVQTTHNLKGPHVSL